MNRFFRIAAALASLAMPFMLSSSAAAQSATDALLFRNGDLLYGQLLAIDAPGAVRWRHPDAAEPIDFKPESVAQIDFPASKNSGSHANNSCRLLLADGDALEGDLVSCDHDAVTVQTSYAGRLKIPRSALQSLVFIPRSPAVFNGITGLDGWTQGISAVAVPGETGRWVYRNGAFYASKAASIARDLKLPDVAEIQFDLAWKGALNLAIALYTDSLQPILLTAKDQGPDFGGFYSLRFQNSFAASVDCWPIKKGERLRQLGQMPFPTLNNKDRMHVDLRISKPRHTIALSLDDTPVKVWVDPEGFVGEGTGMRFVQNLGTGLKLSNLRITEWDGVFADNSTNSIDPARDSFWPENRDRMSGTIESISNGKLTARTANGPVVLPLAQLKSMDFAHPQPAASPTQAATVRATFADGGALNFVLESWRPDEMVIKSPDFGRVKINPAVFTRLQFLSPDKKPAEGPKG